MYRCLRAICILLAMVPLAGCRDGLDKKDEKDLRRDEEAETTLAAARERVVSMNHQIAQVRSAFNDLKVELKGLRGRSAGMNGEIDRIERASDTVDTEISGAEARAEEAVRALR